MPTPLCTTEEVLIEGACFSQCPQYYIDAAYVSPSACVLNVNCPMNFTTGGDFSICQKPTVTRTIELPNENGDCPIGTTFWNSTCSSVCPEGYTIYSETLCTKDCPNGFLSNSLNCFKPIIIRDPTLAQCPLNYTSSSENVCISTLQPFNTKLLLTSIGIGFLSFLILFLFTNDISLSFNSKSKKNDEIPSRFLVNFSNTKINPEQQQITPEFYFPNSPTSSQNSQNSRSFDDYEY
jgi:hypothetical protein